MIEGAAPPAIDGPTPRTTPAVGSPERGRLNGAIRQRENWTQLIRFLLVGAMGFAANIGAYSIAVHLVGVDYRLAALIGFFAGVASNFFWHRHWTFGAQTGDPRTQAIRFVVVYGVTFVIALGILQGLVSQGLARVLAQVISQIVITPLNFLGHKLWSFDD